METAKRDVEELKAKLQDVELADLPKFDWNLCQPKFDGFWALLEADGKTCKVWTANGNLRSEFDLVSVPFEMIAEWNFGTNWSRQHPEVAEFNCHDILSYNHLLMDAKKYIERLAIVQRLIWDLPSNFAVVDTQPISEVNRMWLSYVEEKGFEGLVFKSSHDGFGLMGSNFGRKKKDVSKEYIFMGVSKGNGKYSDCAGSVICGLYVNGELAKITQAGGLSEAQRHEFFDNVDKYIGMVIEIEGKMYFPESGALRHPHFKGFRPDIDPKSCTLEAGLHSKPLTDEPQNIEAPAKPVIEQPALFEGMPTVGLTPVTDEPIFFHRKEKKQEEPKTQLSKKMDNQWHVPSSDGRREYTITLRAHNGEWQCSCPAWTHHTPRRDCKHILSVKASL